MYTRGVTGSNHILWIENWGVPLSKKALSSKPLQQNFTFLRFDTKLDCSQRLKTNRFALFLVVWNRYIDNCISSYTPRAFITVDKQLFPSKCRCLFTQFIGSKPGKYGQKYWLAANKDCKYVVNGFPYVGRDETRSRVFRPGRHAFIETVPQQREKHDIRQLFYFNEVGHTVAKYKTS